MNNTITHKEFVRILGILIDQSPASNLLSVPGVYEVVSEDYNNAVIEYWEQEQESLGY